MGDVLTTRDGLIGNSPRYTNAISPPYQRYLKDDSGAAINLTGVQPADFTITFANQSNPSIVTAGTGTFSVVNATLGLMSYQYGTTDLVSTGNWYAYVTVQLPGEMSPRVFDPELLSIFTLPNAINSGSSGTTLSRNLAFINLRDYCKIDGVTDDSIGFTTAYLEAQTRSMALYHPGGTLLKGGDTLLSGVQIIGAGVGVSIFKLKNGTNVDLFSAQTNLINLSAAANSGSVGTLLNFGLRGLTLDGNKANQSSGSSYPLRFYGYDFILRDLEILNGYSGGALIDWNGGGFIGSPSIEMESLMDNIKFHDNNGIGLQMGGPHDSRLSNLLSFSNGSHNFHLAPNTSGLIVNSCHGYFCPNTAGVCSWLVESISGANFTNCQAEGSFYCNLALLGNDMSWNGGKVFAQVTNWTSVTGIQLGQSAGQTPFPGQINQAAGVTTAIKTAGAYIATNISECRGAGIKFANEANSFIQANIYQQAGTACSGTPATSDEYMINVTGLTSDGTFATSGGVQVRSGSNNAFTIIDKDGNVVFQVNGKAPTGMAINTSVNAGTACVIGPDADNRNCLLLFPNSNTQSVPLFVSQNASFANVFTIDKDGNVVMTASLGIGTGTNSGIAALITPSSDSQKGILLFPHSATQSVPLFTIQNASFSDVFTVDKTGAMHLQGASTFLSGSGAPSNANGANGDFYFRSDTPGTANQRIYAKSAGAWVGIV